MMGRVTTDRRYSVLHNINNTSKVYIKKKNRMKNKSIIRP